MWRTTTTTRSRKGTQIIQTLENLTWSPPVPLTYGAPLTSAQLNATANVPGDFVYTPGLGTTLPVEANKVTVVFTPTDSYDYKILTNNITVTVNAVAVTIASGLAANNKVYDGTTTATLSSNSVVLNGVLAGDAVNVSLTTNGYLASFGSAAAGNGKTVTVSGLGLSGSAAHNYTLTAPSFGASITAKPLTMSGLSVASSRAYDGTKTAAVTGSPVLQGTEADGSGTSADGKPYSGDAVNVSGTPTGTYNSKDVVAATTVNFGGLFLSGAQAGNYSLTIEGGVAAAITTAALSVTANNDAKTYGQTKSYGAGSAAFASAGLKNSETIGSVTITANGGTAATAGVVGSPYTLTPSAATGGTFTPGNYNITYVAGHLTVNQTPLIVSATAEGKTYGQSVTYTSGNPNFHSIGLQNSETIGSVTMAVAGNGGAPAASVAASPYTLTPSAATGGTFVAGNYNITYATGDLNVSPAALTVTANGQTKQHGQTLAFGAGSTLFTSAGLKNSETIGSVTLSVNNNGGAAAAAIGKYHHAQRGRGRDFCSGKLQH